MTSPFTPDDIRKISSFVTDHIGFSYAPDRVGDLIRGFMSACQDLGAGSPAACLKMLDEASSAPRLEEMLVKKLTIGETFFFRDRNLFIQLRDQLLPDLIRIRRQGRKYLQIWSAACSTGEEPYSIAILLRYLIPDIADWDIYILGTDINPGSLHAAERGVYSKWSFREKGLVPTDTYISPGPDGRFQVSLKIKEMVRFSRLNLITDPYPSSFTGTTSMDLILCRNVLMYFSPERAGEVVDRMNSALVDKGWFLVSPQEINYAQRTGFIQVKRSSVFLFQKGKDAEEPVRFPGIPLAPALTPPLPEPVSFQGISEPEEGADDFHTGGGAIPGITPVPAVPFIPKIPTESPETLIQAGRLSDAEYLLLQWKDHADTKTIAVMQMLARAYADQGETERALGWCDHILAIDPLSSGAYHLRAVIQQAQGNISSAVQALRQALYADPDYIPAHLMLGTILGSQGRSGDARRHYQIALRILSAMADDTPVEETDGMPAVRIREMVTVLLDGVAAS